MPSHNKSSNALEYIMKRVSQEIYLKCEEEKKTFIIFINVYSTAEFDVFALRAVNMTYNKLTAVYINYLPSHTLYIHLID